MTRVAFTDRELDVMAVLWQRGETGATVAEVRAALADDLAYTTVLTVLRTLEAKGHVGHQAVGKAYRYRALVPQSAARRGAVQRLVEKLFAGSAVALVAECVTDRRLTGEELERLRRLVDERLRDQGD